MSLTIQTDEIKNKIRTLYLEGLNYKQIMDSLDIKEPTWYTWFYRNTNGFRDYINDIEKELLIRQARQNLKEVINMDIPLDDPRWLKIKTDVSQFIAETLDKDNFSKKQEIDQTQPITINVNSLKDRLPEPIDTQSKQLDNNVAQYTLSPQPQSGNTTPLIENDVNKLTDKE